MKKVFYVLFLLAELVLDLMLLSVLWNSTLYIEIVMIVILWAAILVWLLLKLKRADDTAIKRKLYRRLILGMATPAFLFVVLVIWFIIRLSMVI